MKTLKLLLSLVLLTIALTACSNKEEATRVADKIENGQTLDRGDYTAMIKYLGSFAEAAQPIQNQINDMSADNPDAAKLTAKIDSMRRSLPYLEIFTTKLCKATEAEVGAENVALVNKYSGYEWFTSPDWASISQDPGVAGMVVETPPADSNNGVIAGAVDEEVVHEL